MVDGIDELRGAGVLEQQLVRDRDDGGAAAPGRCVLKRMEKPLFTAAGLREQPTLDVLGRLGEYRQKQRIVLAGREGDVEDAFDALGDRVDSN